MIWHTLNLMFALVSCVIIVAMLLGRAEKIGRCARLGMAFMAAGFLMSAPPIFLGTVPLDAWAFSMTRMGVTLYLVATFGPALMQRYYPELDWQDRP